MAILLIWPPDDLEQTLTQLGQWGMAAGVGIALLVLLILFFAARPVRGFIRRWIFRYSLGTLVTIQILLVLGFWLYFHYCRGQNYPLGICAVAYDALIIVLIAGWWLLPRLSLRLFRSPPVSLLVAGTIGCLVVAGIFQRLKPRVAPVADPVFPPVHYLSPGSFEAQERQKREAARLGLPVAIVNTVGMEFRLIPAGTFMMGSPETEMDHGTGEFENETLHPVTLTRPFYLARTEMTAGELSLLLGERVEAYYSRFWYPGVHPSLPADEITWDYAQVILRRLCEREWVPEGTYRLPSEAEWEYACRAGTRTAFYSGDCRATGMSGRFSRDIGTESALEKVAWYAHNSRRALHPVGRLRPNAWGLHDMHGNVHEWCADRVESLCGAAPENYAGLEGAVDPLGAEGPLRILRGGGAAWSGGGDCRSAARGCAPPEQRFSRGLRVARAVEPRP